MFSNLFLAPEQLFISAAVYDIGRNMFFDLLVCSIPISITVLQLK